MKFKMKLEVNIDIPQEALERFVNDSLPTRLLKYTKDAFMEITDENHKDIFEVGQIDMTKEVKEFCKS